MAQQPQHFLRSAPEVIHSGAAKPTVVVNIFQGVVLEWNPKSEGRRPKEIQDPKSALAEVNKFDVASLEDALPIQISGLFRASVFGLRISAWGQNPRLE